MAAERIDIDMYDDPNVLGEAVGMAGVVGVDNEPHSLTDEEIARRGRAHFNASEIRQHAEQLGKDVFAKMTSRGLVLIVVAAGIATAGAVIVYKHRKK